MTSKKSLDEAAAAAYKVAREQLDQILDWIDLDVLTPIEVIAAVALLRPAAERMPTVNRPRGYVTRTETRTGVPVSAGTGSTGVVKYLYPISEDRQHNALLSLRPIAGRIVL